MEYFILFFSFFFMIFFWGLESSILLNPNFRKSNTEYKNSISATILHLFQNNINIFLYTIHVCSLIAILSFTVTFLKISNPVLQNILSSNFLIITIQVFILIFTVFLSFIFSKIFFQFRPYSHSSLNLFSVFLFLIYILLFPILSFLVESVYAILKLLRLTKKEYDIKNLNYIFLKILCFESLESSSNTSVYNKKKDVKLFQNVLDFSSVKLKNCIVPRTEIVAISNQAELHELTEKFISSGNSKIIVFKENIDNILGYIDSAELFSDADNWKNRIKPMPIVPETMSANKLMNLFIQKKKNIAIVVDEFGGTTGIITLEDIMEEIFGEIEDEHDTKEYIAKKIAENEYILSGRLEIDVINEQFNLTLPESDEYITIAGLVLYYHEKLPNINEVIEIENVKYQTVRMNKNKIELIKITV